MRLLSIGQVNARGFNASVCRHLDRGFAQEIKVENPEQLHKKQLN
jgi:hypothetical protein